MGYDNVHKVFNNLWQGMDYSSASIIINIDHQSPEIFQALHIEEHKIEEIGAGD